MKMETLQKGVYYTDGEYVYGPYDPCNGKPLPNATVRSLEVEQQQKKLQRQQQQQQPQIKKDIDAERKCNQQQQHDTNDIANLTAKYEHIQKSINEHLRQIDAYIESAKTALKSTVPASSLSSSSSSSTGNRPESSSHRQTDQQTTAQHQLPNDFMAQQQLLQQHQQHEEETPLKEILRKITNIMQEVKPLKSKCPKEHRQGGRATTE
ncbi:hypothetical protein DOY81_003187 [Sarcophaga bullata]|nr:hypothetical protein DOY81_003187 [Sarcophaga bullata]